jgi:hypothetical protein
MVKNSSTSSFFPGAFGFHGCDGLFEMVEQIILIWGLILDDAQVLEPGHIQDFLVGEKLFEVFFTVVSLSVKKQAIPAQAGSPSGVLASSSSLLQIRLVTMLLQILHGDFGEGNEVRGFAELGEEDILFSPKMGHQAQLPGLLGCHKVTFDVVGATMG